LSSEENKHDREFGNDFASEEAAKEIQAPEVVDEEPVSAV
jgi:hypothetical protein